jgi:Carboxypeptidase regulatory-like domain
MFLPWLLAVMFNSASPVLAAGQQIRGVIEDASGAVVGGTSVRLLTSVSEEVAHATANDFGKFQMGVAVSGSYVLKAWQRGFRSRRVMVVVPPDGTIDVGNIRLEVAGCDAPGIICDWFGEPPPRDPVVSRGYVEVQTDCMLAFARSKVFCSSDAKGTRESEADVRITKDENGIYLIAINGAALSEPDLPCGDCRDAYPKQTKVRIDGLGPGDDICLHTHDRHWSHLFLTEDVNRGSRQIALWQITRKR